LETVLLFENPVHDCLQQVGYRREEGDRMVAWIERTSNGKPRRVKFSCRRVPCGGSAR